MGLKLWGACRLPLLLRLAEPLPIVRTILSWRPYLQRKPIKIKSIRAFWIYRLLLTLFHKKKRKQQRTSLRIHLKNSIPFVSLDSSTTPKLKIHKNKVAFFSVNLSSTTNMQIYQKPPNSSKTTILTQNHIPFSLYQRSFCIKTYFLS